MAAKMKLIEVQYADEIDQAVTSWIVQGYTVANRTSMSVTLVKRKQFSYFIAIIGFVLILLPLLIYILIYAFQSDKVVEIRATQPVRARP